MSDFKPIGHCGPAKFFKAALVQLGRYHDGTIALVSDPGTERQQVYTVCMSHDPDAKLEPGCVWLKGWSENEGAVEALVEAGIVEPTGRTWPTGFVRAQEARLLKGIDEHDQAACSECGAGIEPSDKDPRENGIQLYAHCSRCLQELPAGTSPAEYARIEAGFTAQGLQIWCTRHDLNIVHIDFEGQQHPAVTDALTPEASS